MKYCLAAAIVTASPVGFAARRRRDNAAMMAHNPLVPIVLHLLRETPDGSSEYELLKRIETDGDHFAALSDDNQLALFQKHFLLMNALYQLQQMLWNEEQLWLDISPLRIVLKTTSALSSSTKLASGGDHALRDYYLYWRNLMDADRESVDALLTNFWRRFYAHDEQGGALKILELEADTEWPLIKQQYRRLAARAHPDRGGDQAQFLAIREAYEILRACRE